MEQEISPDQELIQRSCAIFAYIFDPHVSPYPWKKCPDPEAQYTENLPDFEESLNDYLLREVHKDDIDARTGILEKLTDTESQLVDQLSNTQVESIPIGDRMSQRTATGGSADSETKKRRLEAEVKRRETNERRRREALARKQKAKENAVRQLRKESQLEMKFKKEQWEKEIEEKQVFGRFRANELMRQKEEREQKRIEDQKKEENARKLVERLQETQPKLNYEEETFKVSTKVERQKAQEKMNRMKEISTEIYKKNQETISPRKSPRKANQFSFK